MAAKKFITDPSPPQEGGSYRQDPVTGKLVRATEPTPTTEADPAALEE